MNANTRDLSDSRHHNTYSFICCAYDSLFRTSWINYTIKRILRWPRHSATALTGHTALLAHPALETCIMNYFSSPRCYVWLGKHSNIREVMLAVDRRVLVIPAGASDLSSIQVLGWIGPREEKVLSFHSWSFAFFRPFFFIS